MTDPTRPPTDPNGTGPAVEIAGLRKAFGEQVVLDGIDLTVGRDETLTVLGRSGTGKSVLLKLIVGLEKADAGSIKVEGHEIGGLAVDQLNAVRKRLGFLFQQAALYDSLTVEENVAFPLRRHTDLSDDDRQRRVRELLASVGLERDLEKLPGNISGGMKKRVGLARALALEPSILLLDEPTAGLDPITATEIIDLVQDLRRERPLASIIVTHDLRSAEVLAGRVALLHEGRIRAEGPLAEVQKSEDQFVAAFLRPHAEKAHV